MLVDSDGGDMHRGNLIGLAVSILLITWAGAGFAADIAKIGVLDAQRVLETSSAGKDAKTQIKGKSSTMAEELKTRGSEVEELRKQLEREAMVMSQEKREDKQREYRIKLNDFKGLEKKYRGELKELEQRLIGKIQQDIIRLAEEIGKEEGYLMIVNRPAVVYYPNSIDITDTLIERYNALYAKGQAEASRRN